MSKYLILTDSTCDLPLDIVKKENIIVLPMEYNVGDKSYTYSPYEDFNCDEFYKNLKINNNVSTTQINFIKYVDYFEEYLKEGFDILYIAFSSSLSGTYESSLLAASKLSEKYPDRIIKSIDSKAASIGEGLLVYLANEKKKAGYSLDEVYEWILRNRDNICHYFTVDDLEHLYKGGRISKLSASVGTTLNIKPVLHVDDEGSLVPLCKVHGRKRSLKQLVSNMEDLSISPNEQVIFIGHAGCSDDAEYVKDLIYDSFNPKEVIINHIGPIIGSHSGPKTVALFFYGSNK